MCNLVQSKQDDVGSQIIMEESQKRANKFSEYEQMLMIMLRVDDEEWTSY